METNKHTILNEIARPTTLEGFMCDEDQKKKFQEYIDKQDIGLIGLFGKAGSGKTTLAKILVKNIDCDYLYCNAVDDRSIETIKEKIGGFASAGSFKPLKIIILDEATHILEAGQVLLLNMMETFSLKTRFILTGNYPERLIDPLRSRLQEFELIPPTKKVIGRHVYNILNKEGIKNDPKDIVKIVDKTYPDLRRTFNICQKFTINNELVLGEFTDQNNEYQNLLLEELNNPKRSITKARQILVDANKNDYEDTYKFLYDNLDKYSNGWDAEIIVHLEEGLYRAQTRLNKEINIVATLSKIIQLIE